MKNIVYRASERGYANYDWLQANYSFSFANYYNPARQNFGALRVLNDDIIQGGTGFGEHPHQNMEIITIPLEGTLKHKDSMSNTWIPLHTGEVQVMSAGKGIYHSEKNHSSSDFLNLFQIWIIPDKMNVEPGYDQKLFEKEDRKNRLQALVTSHGDSDGTSLKIHQDARISRIDLDREQSFRYEPKSENHGVYVMVITGKITLDGEDLGRRDAMGIWETSSFEAKASEDAEILLIEVPMDF